MEQVKSNPFEGWTTIEEAAEIVGRQKATLHYWAKHGSIEAHYVGRKVRLVNIEEVKAYAEKNPPYKKKATG